MKSNTARRASTGVRNRCRSRSSHSSVAKKLPLFPERAVLARQPAQLVLLHRRQPVLATPVIEISLPNPVSNRPRRFACSAPYSRRRQNVPFNRVAHSTCFHRRRCRMTCTGRSLIPESPLPYRDGQEWWSANQPASSSLTFEISFMTICFVGWVNRCPSAEVGWIRRLRV